MNIREIDIVPATDRDGEPVHGFHLEYVDSGEYLTNRSRTARLHFSSRGAAVRARERQCQHARSAVGA